MKKVIITLFSLVPGILFAEYGSGANASSGSFGLAAGLAIGIAVLGGTLSQGKVVAAVMDATGRNPSAGGKLFLPMIIGLAFIESLVIVAFVIANGLLGKI